jgi:hypothetical protein
VSAVLTSPKRWRAFADFIALALGLNVWLALIVFPGIFVGAWKGALAALVGMVPVAVLGTGIWRRSEAMLLFGYPTALLLPVALAPDMVAVHVYGPVHFVIVALGLVAYLFGASFFTSFYEPPPPVSVRPLSSSLQPTPPRWRRRARIYRYLLILSVAFPALLLYTINFDPSTRVFIRKMYPGRAASYTAVVNLGFLAFWFLIYSRYLLGILTLHRTGDRPILSLLALTRARLKRRKPRPVFYIAAAAALALMAALILWS